MNWSIAVTPAPFVLAFVICAAVSVYALRRRTVAGAARFGAVSALQACTILGFIFELVSPRLETKVFWDNMQFAGTYIAPVFLLAFATTYTDYDRVKARRLMKATGIGTFILLAIVYTDPIHRLIRPEVWLEPGDPFSALVYPFTPTLALISGFSYLIVFASLFILARRFFNPGSLYESQVVTIILGILVPVIGSALTLAGVRFTQHRDTMPFTFAVGNMIIAWGLFRYRLFDVAPLARDLIFDSMSDPVLVVDMNSRIVDANPALYRIIGNPPEPLIGASTDEVFAPWPDIIEKTNNLYTQTRMEITVKREGVDEHLELAISPLHDAHGRLRGRVFVIHDITDLRAAEEELRTRAAEIEAMNAELEKANAQLLVLSRAKDEFVSNVSHELRTPITNQRLCLQIMARAPERRDTYLPVLEREVDRLEQMIEGLMVLSRLDQNLLALRSMTVSLNTLVAELVRDRVPLAEEHHISLEVETVSDLPEVSADDTLLSQTLSILLTNALTYTPEGGSVMVRTHRTLFEDQYWAGFSVSDTGPGIPPEEHASIFSRFYRGAAAQRVETPGTGLGLSIAKEIVTRHGGRIDLESEGIPGKGTTFSVWLPVRNGRS